MRMGHLRRFVSFLILFCITGSLLTVHSQTFFILGHESITQCSWFELIFFKAEKFYKQGLYDQAEEAFQTASVIAEYKKELKKYIDSRFYLGLCYWNQGRIQDSYQEYVHLLNSEQENPGNQVLRKAKKALEVIKLYKQGMELREQRKFERSLKALQEALYEAHMISRPELKQRILRQISVTYWDMNDIEKFFHYNDLSLDIAKEINHREELSKCLNNLGISHRKSFEYSKALSAYNQALDLSRDLGNIKEESNILHNMGLIYKDFGYYDRAIEYLKQALAQDRKTNSFEYYPSDYMNLGIVYKKKAQSTEDSQLLFKAVDCLRKSLSLSRKQGNEVIELKCLNNLGSSYIELNKFSEAIPYLESSLHKANEIQDYESLGMVLNNLGYVHLNLHSYLEAEDFFNQSVNVALKNNAHHILWEAYFGMGKIKEKQENHLKAIENYFKSIQAIETVKESIVLDLHSAGFVQTKLKVYESLMDLLFSLYKKDSKSKYGEKIFQVAEKAKAQILIENLASLPRKNTQNMKLELRDMNQKISRKFARSVEKILDMKSSKEDMDQTILSQFNQVEQDYIDAINRKYIQLHDNHRFDKPVFYVLEEVQNYLKQSNAVLFEYFLGKNRSYLFQITGNDFHIFPLPSEESITTSIHGYLKILRSPSQGKFKGKTASKRIYKELLSPLSSLDPHSFEHIVIIPSGILYCLPFETLIQPQNENSHSDSYLISRFRVSYMPSSASLLYLSFHKKKAPYTKDLLAFGNPVIKDKIKTSTTPSRILFQLYRNQGFKFSAIPFSGKEIKSISQWFDSKRTDIFLKENASEENLKKTPLADYKIIHFSCHGLLDENYPFRSSLVLSLIDGDKEDGFLQVQEIYDLYMKPQLIVLSACQTGRGTIKRGEGVLGLPRVFFYSGAESILSSLWRVRDKQTSQFMNLFYKNLASGKSKSHSLQLAKIAFINSPKYSNPFYWASFVLNGEFKEHIDF
ncbi:MAG: CHAT domain-containing protein [Candidatus Aminicenantes bacterium]|nr:CHAT domain-containing protein [Candidatus Aminicenantes bacterium]